MPVTGGPEKLRQVLQEGEINEKDTTAMKSTIGKIIERVHLNLKLYDYAKQ